MGFYVMLRGAEKLVPAEYWYPYGTWDLLWLMVGCCNDGRGLTPSSPPPPPTLSISKLPDVNVQYHQ